MYCFNTGIATLEVGVIPVVNALPNCFTTASCWPGSGRLVYDLSGNGFTGSMTGSISSASAGFVSFDSSAATIQVGNGVSAFYSAMDLRKQLYIGLQYQTGSLNNHIEFASTWDTLGTGNFGYCFFLGMGNPASRTRSAIQIYTAAGTSPVGYSAGDPSTTVSFATGSLSNTIGLMANITSGSYVLFNNNVSISTTTGVDTGKWFRWASTGLDPGKGIRIGNRLSGENFKGQFRKFVVYSRALSPTEIADIETWMTWNTGSY